MKNFLYSRFIKLLLYIVFIVSFIIGICAGSVFLVNTFAFGSNSGKQYERFEQTPLFMNILNSYMTKNISLLSSLQDYDSTYSSIPDGETAFSIMDYMDKSIYNYSYEYIESQFYNNQSVYDSYSQPSDQNGWNLSDYYDLTSCQKDFYAKYGISPDYNFSEAYTEFQIGPYDDAKEELSQEDLLYQGYENDIQSDIKVGNVTQYLYDNILGDTGIEPEYTADEYNYSYTKTYVSMPYEYYIALFYMNGELNYNPTTHEMISTQFSPESIIIKDGDKIALYSPTEDIFYSSDNGWFTKQGVLLCNINALDITSSYTIVNSFYNSYGDIIVSDAGPYVDYLSYSNSLISVNNPSISYYILSPALNTEYDTGASIEEIKSSPVWFEYNLKNKKITSNIDSFYNDQSLFNNTIPALGINSTIYVGINTDYSFTGDISTRDFYTMSNIFNKFYGYNDISLIVLIISIVLIVISAITLVSLTGRKSAEDETIYLNGFDKCFNEITMSIIVIMLAVPIVLLFILYDQYSESISRYGLATIGVFILVYSVILLSLYGLSIIRQLKANNFLNSFLTHRMVVSLTRALKSAESKTNVIFKNVIYIIFYLGVNCSLTGVMIYSIYASQLVSLIISLCVFALTNLIVLSMLIIKGIGFNNIIYGTKKITEGQLDYKINTDAQFGSQKNLALTINNMGDGMQKAIEQSIKDERAKAALITNVSHDIKTPLTSIISYVDLLKRSNIDNPDAIHYLDVLEQKSARLKQLTEDLVEASKVTSGNVELNMVPLNLKELIYQATGEFEDKFSEKNLTIVESITDENTTVLADGKRTYRVLDNLLQNVYKYALENTRVYLDLNVIEQNISSTSSKDSQANLKLAQLSIKNISKAPLNISVDQLTERFTRGDASRSTEGSGLGLSIAKDLTKLQDGEFDISLDGDLFKVTITFNILVNNINPDSNLDNDVVSESPIDKEEEINKILASSSINKDENNANS